MNCIIQLCFDKTIIGYVTFRYLLIFNLIHGRLFIHIYIFFNLKIRKYNNLIHILLDD